MKPRYLTPLCHVCGITPAPFGFAQVRMGRSPGPGKPAPDPILGPRPLYACGAHRGEVEAVYGERLEGRKRSPASAKPAPDYSDPIPESGPEYARAHVAPAQGALF